jgi:predicted transglutaminase-like cysteine proteinase
MFLCPLRRCSLPGLLATALTFGAINSAWPLTNGQPLQRNEVGALLRAASFQTPLKALVEEQTPSALETGIRRLRSATWWEANRKLRPELAQVGDLMFLLSLSDTRLEQSPPAAARVQRLRNAMRAHMQRQPPGWSRLVAQVREERVKTGDFSALLLVNSLINEIGYRDGTDGTYYPPARFFSESGVCKDYAVAKYLLLRDAGFDISRLRLVSLAPRYNNTRDDWHVMLVAHLDAMSEPLALDSPPPPAAKRDPDVPDNEGSTDAEVQATVTGPSPLLKAILTGHRLVNAVLRAPAGPVVAALGVSSQAGRPLATVFNEQGSLSFERDAPTSAWRRSAVSRSVRTIVADRDGKRWRVDASGVFPKWHLAPTGTMEFALRARSID